MSRIELAPDVGNDFDRIVDHPLHHQVENTALRVQEIIEALSVLGYNPLIGRPVNNDKKELVIGRRLHGYVTLYRYIAEVDTAFVLAVRNQRQAGYTKL